MPKSKIYGVYWHICAQCGVQFPEGRINKNDLGEWICYRCWGKDGGK